MCISDDMGSSHAIFDKFKEANPVNQAYIDALNHEVIRISVKFDTASKEFLIFIDLMTVGMFRLSLQFFYGRSLTELWVLRPKVSTSFELGVLLNKKLREYAKRAGPEVIEEPSQVKFLKGDILQTCHLNIEALYLYTAKHLVWIEHILRSHGFPTQAKIRAADHI